MKIKGFVIAGVLLLAVGGGVAVYAANRSDFNVDNVFLDANFEEKNKEFGEIVDVEFEGMASKFILSTTEETNKLSYSESTNFHYDIVYDELTKKLTIKQKIDQQTMNIRKTVAHLYLNHDLVNLAVNLKVGEVSIENVNFTNLDINVNAGSVELTKVVTTTGSIEVNCGDIDINATSDVIKLKTYTGSIEYSGFINSLLNVEISCGQGEINLYQDRSVYKINGVGDGSIDINYSVNVGKVDLDFGTENL